MKALDEQSKKLIEDAFSKFCETVAALRDPDGGCPWDLQQTHQTLRRYMIEEAYEAAHAMSEGPAAKLCDELGDVLLQVVLNAQLAKDQKDFSIVDVIKAIDAKMRRRHPHVFDKVKVSSTAEVHKNWDQIKAQEDPKKPKGFFAEHASVGPSAIQAAKIGRSASKINFDWLEVREVWAQVKSEFEEVGEALESSAFKPSAEVKEEIGDLYFTIAQLCRHLNYDPELTAIDGNLKFLRRFQSLEALAPRDLSTLSRDELEALWKKVKSLE